MKFIRHEEIYPIEDFRTFEGEKGLIYIPNSPWKILKRLDSLQAFVDPLDDVWKNESTEIAPIEIFKFAGRSDKFLYEHHIGQLFNKELFANQNSNYLDNIQFTSEIGCVVPPIVMFSILFQNQFRLATVGHNHFESKVIFYDFSSRVFVPISIFRYCNRLAENVPQFMNRFIMTFDNIEKIQMNYELTKSHFER